MLRQDDPLLDPGERVILQNEAYLKTGHLREFFGGQAFLTTKRIIWKRRYRWLVSLPIFKMPEHVFISLGSITKVDLKGQLGTAWLTIESGQRTYAIRLGKGPFPLMRDHARITKKWFEAISGLRAHI
jgi:hypothetical protein